MSDLRPFLTWILERHADLGAITEIRVLRKTPSGVRSTWAGYFGPDDLDALAKAVTPLPDGPRARMGRGDHPRSGEANFYFSLQGVDPGAVEGPRGRLGKAKVTAKDRDIAVYTLFVVDVDPERKPKGISATDAEKAHAKAVADKVRAWFEARGIRAVTADSGNGVHLLIPLVPYRGEDLPRAATDAHTLLKLLHDRFSTPQAKVDTSTFNPSRILKLYGTMAVKGENSLERPHRLASVDLSEMPPDVDLFARVKADLEAFRAELKVSKPTRGRDKRATHRRSGRANPDWRSWRDEALDRLPLEAVYGELLTGRTSGQGWLECRDPSSTSGDAHPSAGVADGGGEARRGNFHSFITSETLSVFDFLIHHGRASDIAEASRMVAEWSGVPIPSQARKAARSQAAIESFLQSWKGAKGQERQNTLLRRFLKKLIGTSALELRPLMDALHEGTGLPRQVLNATLAELKKSRKAESRAAPPVPKGRTIIDYVTNQTSVAGLFDAILAAIRPLDRFFRTEEEVVFIRLGIGPQPVSERNLPGFLSAFVEIRFLSEDDEGQRFLRYGVLPSELARAFANDPRVRAKLPPLANYARSPLFTRDWAFVATPGYHRHDGGIFYDGPEVRPAEAGTPHLDEVLAGFRFKEEADRVNFIGVILTALTMPHWGRGHPFLAINGNKPGVGKSTLAKVLGVLVEGREPTSVTWVPDDTEFEKQIATRVEAGDHVIVVDNAKTSRAIQSAVLERCITDSRPNFRRLGSNTAISRPQNDLLFCLTMNMTQLGRDLRRRALPVNLYLEEDVRQVDYPLDDVVGFAIEHRLELVAELSGMVLRWRDGGAQVPDKSARHSTSRAWARTIDAILWSERLEGFLTNFEASMHAFDPDFDRMQEICSAHHDQPPSTAGEWAELLKESLMEDRFKTRAGNYKAARSMATLMGNLFKAYLDASFEVEGRRYGLVQSHPRGQSHSAVYQFAEEG